MKLLKMKLLFSAFITFIVGSVLIIIAFNSVQIYGQKLSTDECGDLLEKYFEYKKNYKECFNGSFVEEFVPKKTDSFGITTLEDEWSKMDAFNANYRNDPEQHLFIIVYGGKINKYNEFNERTKRLTYYLKEKLQIPKQKITVVSGGFREKFEFEFWLSPSEKIFPPLSPTVNVEDVKFKGKMKPLPLDLGS